MNNTKTAHEELKEWASRKMAKVPTNEIVIVELARRAIAEHETVESQIQETEAQHLIQVTALQKERDQLKAQLLEREKAASFTANANIELRKEIKELKAQLEQTQKCCAEMRDALQGCNEMFDTYGHTSESPCVRDKEIVAKMLHALSSNCGKGYVSIEQVRVLKEALEYCGKHNHTSHAVEFTERPCATCLIVKQALDLCAKLTFPSQPPA